MTERYDRAFDRPRSFASPLRPGGHKRWLVGLLNRKWQKQGVSFDQGDMERLHDEFWRSNGEPVVLAWELSESATAALVERCRQEQVTARKIHGAILRALQSTDLFRMLTAETLHPTLLDSLYFAKYGLITSRMSSRLLAKMRWRGSSSRAIALSRMLIGRPMTHLRRTLCRRSSSGAAGSPASPGREPRGSPRLDAVLQAVVRTRRRPRARTRCDEESAYL